MGSESAIMPQTVILYSSNGCKRGVTIYGWING